MKNRIFACKLWISFADAIHSLFIRTLVRCNRIQDFFWYSFRGYQEVISKLNWKLSETHCESRNELRLETLQQFINTSKYKYILRWGWIWRKSNFRISLTIYFTGIFTFTADGAECKCNFARREYCTWKWNDLWYVAGLCYPNINFRAFKYAMELYFIRIIIILYAKLRVVVNVERCRLYAMG